MQPIALRGGPALPPGLRDLVDGSLFQFPHPAVPMGAKAGTRGTPLWTLDDLIAHVAGYNRVDRRTLLRFRFDAALHLYVVTDAMTLRAAHMTKETFDSIRPNRDRVKAFIMKKPKVMLVGHVKFAAASDDGVTADVRVLIGRADEPTIALTSEYYAVFQMHLWPTYARRAFR